MKLTAHKAALALALSAIGMQQQAAQATEPSASGHGSVSLNNAVNGSFSVGSNGSSTSYATARQSAGANLSATATNTPGYGNVKAGIAGTATTESYGKAYNVSTGSGRGLAMSAGSADAAVQGRMGIHGVTQGFNGGSASTEGGHIIRAGTNQGSYAVGNTAAGFDAQVEYQRNASRTPAPAGWTGGTRNAGVNVVGTSTGYGTGTNQSGALQGMNAAGLANIWGTGRFNAGTNLEAWTHVGQP